MVALGTDLGATMTNANDYVAAVFGIVLWIAHNGYSAPVPQEFWTDDERAAHELAEDIRDREARSETGEASLFWEPQPLACGEYLSYKTMRNDWAAHPSLPCWTRVTVTSLDNGLEVDVIIVDRGPYIDGRIIDLVPYAGAKIGLTRKRGVMPVRIEWNPLESQYPPPVRRRR